MTKENGLLCVVPARKFPQRRATKISKRLGPKEGNLLGGGAGFANKMAELLFVLWQWLTVDYLQRK